MGGGTAVSTVEAGTGEVMSATIEGTGVGADRTSRGRTGTGPEVEVVMRGGEMASGALGSGGEARGCENAGGAVGEGTRGARGRADGGGSVVGEGWDTALGERIGRRIASAAW